MQVLRITSHHESERERERLPEIRQAGKRAEYSFKTFEILKKDPIKKLI
ncbi:hypothetical protein [Methanoplanus limicola]|uniref:Uncharacterized protein n=1 Tax=Methanoplanus limicola DSM 2279 TaxID=937775 RepID=H1Z2A7_9EURY|nr:hypothetical protein [Methanoplanus limicola]EHQ34636.1 hypothetical protein Metlim_0499 [Methanoplanus limicola DSM 2279]